MAIQFSHREDKPFFVQTSSMSYRSGAIQWQNIDFEKTCTDPQGQNAVLLHFYISVISYEVLQLPLTEADYIYVKIINLACRITRKQTVALRLRWTVNRVRAIGEPLNPWPCPDKELWGISAWKPSGHARRSTNAALLLGQRLRRWSNIKPALAERLVSSGSSHHKCTARFSWRPAARHSHRPDRVLPTRRSES